MSKEYDPLDYLYKELNKALNENPDYPTTRIIGEPKDPRKPIDDSSKETRKKTE